MTHHNITTCLWFDGSAEESVEFYVSVCKDSGITGSTPGLTGAALVVTFRLAGASSSP
jgi:predicted 3-demethylubiquinone-9 3-methyltransferase (glyoxalase superfamily)